VQPTREIESLSLHDALPIYEKGPCRSGTVLRVSSRYTRGLGGRRTPDQGVAEVCGDHLAELPVSVGAAAVVVAFHVSQVDRAARSEEHTSELQSRENLVCRL